MEESESVPAELVNQWIAAEEDFSANGYDGLAASAVEMIHGSGRPWLVLTAPHAVNHWREGALKLADRGTGGLVRVLSRALRCYGLIAGRQTYSDPSYDDKHELKNQLMPLMDGARALIDFHGMSDQRDIDAEVGLGLFPNSTSERLALVIEAALKAAALSVAHHEVYVSPHPHSITNWGLAHGLPAVQLELAARTRPPLGSPNACETLVHALMEALSVDSADAFR